MCRYLELSLVNERERCTLNPIFLAKNYCTSCLLSKSASFTQVTETKPGPVIFGVVGREIRIQGRDWQGKEAGHCPF